MIPASRITEGWFTGAKPLKPVKAMSESGRSDESERCCAPSTPTRVEIAPIDRSADCSRPCPFFDKGLYNQPMPRTEFKSKSGHRVIGDLKGTDPTMTDTSRAGVCPGIDAARGQVVPGSFDGFLSTRR